MNSKKIENGYILRLIKGERVVEKIISFCEENNINSASITGIGGVSEAELGYYDLSTKEYHWRKFEGLYEITSFSGNIALVEGKPVLHSHITISDTNFQAFGGHLKEAIVGPTCEVIIKTFSIGLTRSMDDEIGLKLLDLTGE